MISLPRKMPNVRFVLPTSIASRNSPFFSFVFAIFIALLGQFTFNRLTGNAFAVGKYATLPALMMTALVAMMVIVPFALKAAKKNQA